MILYNIILLFWFVLKCKELDGTSQKEKCKEMVGMEGVRYLLMSKSCSYQVLNLFDLVKAVAFYWK